MVISYFWATLLQPLLERPVFPDFKVFFAGAVALRQGADPYLPFLSRGGRYDFQPLYNYPPITAWLIEPLVAQGPSTAALLVLLVLQLCVAAFVFLVYRALRPLPRQEVALGLLLALGFGPVYANLWNDQVNLVLLGLSGAMLLGYVRGDAWWGGAAYGAAVAFKPLQPVQGLLLAWGRRRWMLAAAVVVGLALLLLPGPPLAWEFVTRVLTGVAGGTGFRENATPAGFLERLFHPAAFYDASAPGGPLERAVYLAIALGVIGLTWWRLGSRPRVDGLGRAAELATATAASPLVLTVAHTFHLVLLLLPILVLLRLGIARSDGRSLAAAAGGWLLLGPVHFAMLTAMAGGFSNDLVLRAWNECQLLGVVVLWLGCLQALRERSEEPALQKQAQDDHPVRDRRDPRVGNQEGERNREGAAKATPPDQLPPAPG